MSILKFIHLFKVLLQLIEFVIGRLFDCVQK